MNKDEYGTRSDQERTHSNSVQNGFGPGVSFGGESGASGGINADKPVFTLSVAADILGLHPRTLRIYEEHDLVVPARTPTKRRRYSQNDIRKFQFIQHLTHDLGVNLAGVDIILEMMDELSKHGIDYSEALLARQPKDL